MLLCCWANKFSTKPSFFEDISNELTLWIRNSLHEKPKCLSIQFNWIQTMREHGVVYHMIFFRSYAKHVNDVCFQHWTTNSPVNHQSYIRCLYKWFEFVCIYMPVCKRFWQFNVQIFMKTYWCYILAWVNWNKNIKSIN